MKSCDRALIVIAALIIAGFGVWLLVKPEALGGIGINLDGPSARIDIRATYGGFELGVAAFLLVCAARAEWRRVGLIAATLIVAGFGLGRGVGMLIEGGAEPLMWYFLAIEAVYTTVAIICLRCSANP